MIRSRHSVKILTTALAFLGLAATMASSQDSEHDQPDPQRATWQALYRAPTTIPFPEDNPYDPRIAALGERLFHDPNLSLDRNRACASCHVATLAWTDGRARAERLDGGDLELRTPSLLGLAASEGRLGWDGKFKNLEAVAFGPITGPTNMGLSEDEAIRRISADPAYGPLTRTDIERALATYERTIPLATTPFDRWIAGDAEAIPVAARRGFDLFNGRAHCAACHSGYTFTDGSFHDIGVAPDDEPGRGRLMPKSLKAQHAFKTPGLRECPKHARFMHNGSLDSLEAVVDLYSRGGTERPSLSSEIHRLDLTAAERADLVAFLRTLASAEDAPPLQSLPAVAGQ